MEIYHQQNFSLLDAAIDGQFNVAKRLINEGADLEERSENGTTALLNATMHGNTDIARLLIEHGADVNCRKSPEEITPLMIACSNGQQELAELLLSAGAQPKDSDEVGNVSMHYACFGSSLDVIQKVYNSYQKAINLSNNDQNTPLLIAAREGRLEVVTWLLDNGADPAHVNQEGESILLWMVTSIATHSLESLKPYYSDLKRLLDKQLPLPWIKACLLGRMQWVELFLKWDVPIDLQDQYGNTGLHYAVAGGDVELVQMLLNNNADLELRSADGFTAAKLAQHSGSEEMKKLFE